MKSRNPISSPLAFGCLLLVMLLAAVLLPPHSKATRQTSAVGTSPRETATSEKRRRPETVPGEALVRFKQNRAFEGQTLLNVSDNAASPKKILDLSTTAPERIPISIDRFAGSDLVEGLRIARMSPDETMKAIAALNARDDVLYAEPNYIVHEDKTPNDPSFGQLYALNLIGAPQAWDITTGNRNIVVAVIDEGIDIAHPDLQANIWTNPAPGSIAGISGDVNGFDFRDNTGVITGESHATHVAGTVGAVGDNSVGVAGVNWQVSVMSLRFISEATSAGTEADSIKAYNYVKQMRDLWGSSGHTKGANIRAVNASYGGGGYSQASADAISAMGQSGVLFVAAAGNESTDSDTHHHYPSGYSLPNVISVAATTSTDTLASFSNFGSQSVMLGAPGSNIFSTTPNNTYSSFSGTSMATPHVTGAAALLCSANANLSVNQLRALLSFNGDIVPALQGKTLTGRRLNVFKSLQAINENDTTPPGTVSNLQVASQNGRSINLSWTASGDDGAAGQASLYDISFVDQSSSAVIPLTSVAPVASGASQSINLNIPYRHLAGTIRLREFDNVGNEGTPTTASVTVPLNAADPYTTALNSPAALSTGGTPLGLNFDDRYLENYSLPFSFPFFGQSYSTVTISTNGNLYFSTPPKRPNGDADDVPGSTADLSLYKMIAGMWDDLDLSTSRRADADVYVVQPGAGRIIFRWQGVQFGDGTIGDPINFEIELRPDGSVITRYGAGNTNLFPVVGISGGEPDPYVIDALTSETSPKTLTNAQSAVFTPRSSPLVITDFFVRQQYLDFLNREPDTSGFQFWTNNIESCGSNAGCREVRRIDTSAAFFLSIEFKETGYLVERIYKAAYGDGTGTSSTGGSHNVIVPIVRLNEFLPDTQRIGQGVIVNQGNWQQQLDANKQAFMAEFVQRSRFLTAFPLSMTPADFVDKLNNNAKDGSGNKPLSVSERNQLVSELTNGTKTRADVLRAVAEDPDLANSEINRAFVLMEYFGYLRRNPFDPPESTLDYAGYEFWLNKLNQFGGNYINAEMVKAFLSSIEYGQRFSP